MTEYAKVTVKFLNGNERAFGLLEEDVLFYRDNGEGTEVLHVGGEWLYANTQEPMEKLQNKTKLIPGVVEVTGVPSTREEAEEWVKAQE